MQPSTPIALLASVLALASCSSSPDANRPFTGQAGTQSLDQAPNPAAPQQPAFINPNPPVAGAPTQVLAPQVPAPIPAPAPVVVAPQTPAPLGNPNAASPSGPISGNPAPTTSVGGIPVARPVPGRPGMVFSPRDQNRVINVEGLKPGTKARDPQTNEIFIIP